MGYVVVCWEFSGPSMIGVWRECCIDEGVGAF